MADIDELSRVIGSLESNIQTLFHKQDSLCIEIKALTATIQNRKLRDSAKVFMGGIIGGFSAMATKMLIWG